MSGGYQVVMSDLQAMAQTFAKQSQALSGAVKTAGVAEPDGGDATINAALSAALDTAGLATGQLSAAVASHGSKLHSAWQKYRDVEETNARLVRQLTSLITGAS